MTLVFLAATRTRLDWGFGNPNITAALIATLLVAAWTLPALCRREWPKCREAAWWIALGLSAWLGQALMFTRSRGGLVAAGTGLALLALYARRPWARRHLAAALAVIALCGYWAHTSGTDRRISASHVAQDASIGNRLKIWRHIPAMIADAPGGHESGRGVRAYMDWYQETDWYQEYDVLVSTHLTCLVECGWWGRFAYLGGWALAFRLAWPGRPGAAGRETPGAPPSAVPFALLVAWFTALVFSSVSVWPLWILPGIATAYALTRRLRACALPGPRALGLTAALPGAALAVGLLPYYGRSGLRVSDGGDTVLLGEGPPTVIIIAGTDTKESPRRLRELRDAGALPGPVLWTRRPERVSPPEQPTPVAIFGKPEAATTAALIAQAPGVAVMAPPYPPENVFTADTLRKVSAYYGEFSASPLAETWRETGRCAVLPGMADFIADWPDRVFALTGKKIPHPPEAEDPS